MLSIHSWWIVFPALVPATAALAWRRRRDPDTLFLLAWIGIFFAVRARRFSLPGPPATCCRWPPRSPSSPRASPSNGWRPPSPRNSRSGSALAAANYQHWDGYRAFAAALRADHPPATASGWTTIGACATTWKPTTGVPARKGQHVRPGDIIVSSELGHNVEFTAPLSRLADADDSALRFRCASSA